MANLTFYLHLWVFTKPRTYLAYPFQILCRLCPLSMDDNARIKKKKLHFYNIQFLNYFIALIIFCHRNNYVLKNNTSISVLTLSALLALETSHRCESSIEYFIWSAHQLDKSTHLSSSTYMDKFHHHVFLLTRPQLHNIDGS